MADLAHVPATIRNDFEQHHGVSFCQRCGCLLEWDDNPELVIERHHCPGLPTWSWPYPWDPAYVKRKTPTINKP